jgi:hypothetical protein
MAVSLKENNWFFVTDQTPPPYPTRSLPAQLWHWCMEWRTVWVSTKPLITEENLPGQGLNPGLPNDTPALYPLLHKLMLTFYACLQVLVWNVQDRGADDGDQAALSSRKSSLHAVDAVGPPFNYPRTQCPEMFLESDSNVWLPDFVLTQFTKLWEIYQIVTKSPNSHKMYQRAVIYFK